YIRSTNGGTVWSSPARLNDDPPGIVRQQVEPWVTTSPNGWFHSVWYDEREDSTQGVVFQIYYSQSTDGGGSWSPNVRASDGGTDLNVGIPAWGGAAGDYIGIAATNSEIYGAWTDTRRGNEDIYVVRGRLGTTSTPTQTQTPTATRTSTATSTATRTRTPTGTRTATSTATHTSTPGSTATRTFTPTSTISPTRTSTPGSTASPTRTRTATVTPTPAGIISGHKTWQGIGQPSSNNVGLIDVLKVCVGGVTQSYAATTDASGTITFTTGLSNGTYSYQVKGAHNLANSGSLTISGGRATVEFGTQRAGDANGDNAVTSADFAILKTQFGQHGGSADFNNDALVNAADFTLLRGNFGFGGVGFACP
ncbi:MAG: dockerin type I repeat-containing protein, partial [Chloroflexia bacterium]